MAKAANSVRSRPTRMQPLAQPAQIPGLRSAPLRFNKPARGFPWLAGGRCALGSRALLAHVSAWCRCPHVLSPLLDCLRRTPRADVDKRWRARYLIAPTLVNPEPSVVREGALLSGDERCRSTDLVSPDPRRVPAAGAPAAGLPTLRA